MNSFVIKASAALLCLGVLGSASATPVDYVVDGPGPCDAVTPTGNHELGGPVGVFPADEQIEWVATTLDRAACAATNMPHPDTLVRMTNLTGIDWVDVWFVSDGGRGNPGGPTLTNVDAIVNGAEAFRIDSIGANTPLVFESIAADGIFEAGEIWDFIVQDWAFAGPGACGPGSAPFGPGVVLFTSPGKVGTPSCDGPETSNASIIARAAVPEPDALGLLGLGLAALGFASVASRRR